MDVNVLSFEQQTFDQIDKKIITHLTVDNRYSRKKLSSQLKVSLSMLNYRIKRLQKELISPTIIINYPAIKFQTYVLFLSNVSREQVNALKNSKEVYTMYKLMGKYDYMLNVATQEIDMFLKEQLSESLFEIYPIVTQIKDRFNPFNFTLPKEEIKRNLNKEIKLEKYDKKILYELCKNPSLSNFEISGKTKINWMTVKKRVNNLISEGIIQRFGNVINVSRYNFLLYMLKIKSSPKSINKLIETANENIYGGYIFKSHNMFTMHYLPPSPSLLSKFIKTLKEIDSTTEIEAYQNDGEFYVNLTPQSFLDFLKEKVD